MEVKRSTSFFLRCRNEEENVFCFFCYHQRNLFTLETFSSRIQTKLIFPLKYFTGFCWLNANKVRRYFANCPRRETFPMSFILEDELLNTAVRAALNLLYTTPPPSPSPPPTLPNYISSVGRPPLTIFYLCLLFFKLNILVFYLLFCLKVYERWNSWTTSVHFYMALHLFLYVWLSWILFWSVESDAGGAWL